MEAMKVKTISHHIESVGKEAKDVPAFLPDLTRQTSEEIIKKWAKSTNILPEYKKAYNQIIVSDEWMIHTRLRRLMDDLGAHFSDDETMKQKYVDRGHWARCLLALISKAFECDSNDAKTKRDLVSGNNIYNILNQLWDKMIWRRPLLTLAVELYAANGDKDAILAGFGTTIYLAQNCITAKRIAFNFILANAHRSVIEAQEKKAGGGTFFKPEKKKAAKDMTFAEAKEKIYEMMEVYLDQHKEYAIKSSILEPTKYCYDRMGQEHNKNSNDVHGYNYPAAIILSCLHVQMPMIPMMGDKWADQGFLDCWATEGETDKLWEEFKKPENFGRAYSGMKTKLQKLKLSKFPKSGSFYKVGPAKTPKNIANIAVNPDSKYDDVREHISEKYIAKFAYFFTKGFFLKKCFEVLNQEALPEYMGFPAIFQRCFEEYKKEKKDIKTEKVIEWLYDEYFIDIDVDKVWELFTYLGITKPPSQVRVPKDKPLGKTIEEWVKAAEVDLKIAGVLEEQGYDDLEWLLTKSQPADIADIEKYCEITKEQMEDLVEVLDDWKLKHRKKKTTPPATTAKQPPTKT